MFIPRVKDHIGKTVNIRHEKYSVELLVRVIQKTPKTSQVIAITLVPLHPQRWRVSPL